MLFLYVPGGELGPTLHVAVFHLCCSGCGAVWRTRWVFQTPLLFLLKAFWSMFIKYNWISVKTLQWKTQHTRNVWICLFDLDSSPFVPPAHLLCLTLWTDAKERYNWLSHDSLFTMSCSFCFLSTWCLVSVCNADYPCEGMSRHATFENFGMAFLTLFQVSTGDNWNGIMKVLLFFILISSFWAGLSNGPKWLFFTPLYLNLSPVAVLDRFF